MLTGGKSSVLNECVLNGKRRCALYFCDSMTFDGQRSFISADLRNILSIGEDGELPESGLRPASEVSA
jgi:hypothetical protein